MAAFCTPISTVSGGRKGLKLKTSVAHIWCIHDKDRPDEISCMNLLLVDEKVCNYSFVTLDCVHAQKHVGCYKLYIFFAHNYMVFVL